MNTKDESGADQKRVVLVTGGNRGIGLAAALSLSNSVSKINFP